MERYALAIGLWILLAFSSLQCAKLQTKRYPISHHSALNQGSWQPLVPDNVAVEPLAQGGPDDSPAETRIELRPRMVALARQLLEAARPQKGFGAKDLELMFESLNLDVGWSARLGLAELVEIGRKKGAYLTEGEPFPGDIILFHNQWDANENGEIDDWYTGCGIVMERGDTGFDAVVRTGNAPRSVAVWPERPFERVVNGEVVNSFLRVPSRNDPPGASYLAGQLYAGYLDVELLIQNSME